MKSLSVPLLKTITDHSTIRDISLALDQQVKHPIAIAPWSPSGYKPLVQFAIAYTADTILLKYYVREKDIRIQYWHPNEPVYKDSCVEFFVSFDSEPAYYNFEFNCAGTCLAGFGEGRHNRALLPLSAIGKIKHLTRLEMDSTGFDNNISWELTVLLPADLFCYHHLSSLKGKLCAANFYKCGNDLPEPHYLAWSPVESEKPDFHVPRFFGQLHFT